MSFLSTLAASRGVTRPLPIEAASRGVDLLGGGIASLLFGRDVGVSTPAGVFVDQRRAESITAFWRGANIWAIAVGTLPLLVYQKDGRGRDVPVWDDRERIIWEKPNPEVSREVFWMDAVLRYAATGDCFIRVVTAPDRAAPRGRRPIELWPIETERVSVGRAGDGRKVYVVDGNFDDPKMDFVSGGTIVHIPGPTTNGVRGTSPVLRFARTLGLAIAEEIYQSSLLGNGTQINGYLSSDQTITLAQAEELARLWDERHKGSENAGRTPVMGKGTKWQSTQLNAVDSRIMEAVQMSLSDIGRMFGEPEWMLGSHSKDSSWGSGLEEQFRTFIVVTLADPITRFQGTISDELVTNPKRFARFDQTPLTRGKLVDQVNALGAMVRAGFDPEESATMVGLPPVKHTGLPPVTLQADQSAVDVAGEAGVGNAN